jgi:hypothetical protein
MYSLAAGVDVAAIEIVTVAAVVPVFTTLMLNVPLTEDGTVYTTVLVFAEGAACPKIPVAMFFPYDWDIK